MNTIPSFLDHDPHGPRAGSSCSEMTQEDNDLMNTIMSEANSESAEVHTVTTSDGESHHKFSLNTWKQLAQHSPQATFLLDHHFRIVHANPSGEVLFGHLVAQMAGRAFEEYLDGPATLLKRTVMHPETNKIVKIVNYKCFCENQEANLRTATFQSAILPDNFIALYLTPERVDRLIRHKCAAMALRRAPFGHVTVNSDLIIIAVNPELCRMYKYVEDDLIGKNIRILVPENLRKLHDHYFANYMRRCEQLGLYNSDLIEHARDLLTQKSDGTPLKIKMQVNRCDRYFVACLIDCSKFSDTQEVHIQNMAKICRGTLLNHYFESSHLTSVALGEKPILNLDLVSSTQKTQARDDDERPFEIVRQLTEELEDAISAFSGCIIKGSGDGFWAIFDASGINKAKSAELEAKYALSFALYCVAWATRKNESTETKDFELRVAVATAPVKIGKISETFDFIGKGPNKCARLAGDPALRPMEIVVDEATFAHCKSKRIRGLVGEPRVVQAKGFAEPLQVRTVLLPEIANNKTVLETIQRKYVALRSTAESMQQMAVELRRNQTKYMQQWGN